MRKSHVRFAVVSALAVAAMGQAASAAPFTAGNLVISIYGSGPGTADNSASPITLQEITTSGNIISQMMLPQTASGGNSPISGEYGSSSEGTLQRSADGQSLTIAGYGVNAAAFNADPAGFGGGTKNCINIGTCFPLAQTASVAGTVSSGPSPVVVVPRVIALIGADGSVDTSTALTGVFNENNPRSVATVNGSQFYISGQGLDKNDTTTQGLFVAVRGATHATAIDTSFDTRITEIQRGQLYLSADSTEGSGVHENISSYSAPGALPTGPASAVVLPNLSSKFTVGSASQLNTLDTVVAKGTKIYLSPEQYFFANATTLYVADGGNPKGDNNGSGKTTQGLSDGGLQKWVFDGTNWNLEYTLSAGLLDFVADTAACGKNSTDCGTTGLIGLAGQVVGDTVQLFATNSTLGDEDPTYLYSVIDSLSATSGAGESFTAIATAAQGTNIRGVAFAPSAIPEPISLSLLGTGLAGLLARRRRKLSARAA